MLQHSMSDATARLELYHQKNRAKKTDLAEAQRVKVIDLTFVYDYKLTFGKLFTTLQGGGGFSERPYKRRVQCEDTYRIGFYI